jgi:hypothetical protein
MALNVLAYNMKRVMAIVGVGGLLEAMRPEPGSTRPNQRLQEASRCPWGWPRLDSAALEDHRAPKAPLQPQCGLVERFSHGLGHGRKTNHVRGDGSFPQKRSPDAGDGCTADPLTTGLAVSGGT